jgi:flagellar hook-basal body complex protein FliE
MIVPSIGIGSLGTSIGGLGTSIPSTGTAAAGATNSSGKSFGDALTNAIGSLENSQTTAAQSAQQLATGQATDPTTAITAVENASLSMDFASQIRNQLDTVASTLFQTQV